MATRNTITDETWAKVKLMVENGASYKEAAKQFSIKSETIRRKAYRGNWLVTENKRRVARKKIAEFQLANPESTLEEAAQMWLGRQVEHRENVSEISEILLNDVLNDLREGNGIRVKSIKDLEMITNISRDNLELAKPGTAGVQVNVQHNSLNVLNTDHESAKTYWERMKDAKSTRGNGPNSS